MALRQADNTILHNFREGSIGYMPTLKWKPNCEDKTYKCLYLSSNIFDAFKT